MYIYTYLYTSYIIHTQKFRLAGLLQGEELRGLQESPGDHLVADDHHLVTTTILHFFCDSELSLPYPVARCLL